MPLRYALATLLLLAPFVAQAQTPGSCARGQATAELSLSDVRAAIYNQGNLFFAGGGSTYEVPKDGGVNAMFGLDLWTSGVVGGDVRAAASLRLTGYWSDFWPGPLDDGAALPDANDCSAYDRIFRVSAPELAAYEAGGVATPALAEWPVGLGAPAVDASGAPVVPTSREQTVDLAAGERPVVYGTETLFWVMNDVGGEHLTTGTPPLGIEVRASAFSVNDPDAAALDQSTFYRYEIVNRSSQIIEDFRLGWMVDPDIGGFSDDFIGSDSTRSLLYVYNGDDDDESSQGGYGVAPPALGFDILSGAAGTMFVDDDGPPSPASYDANYIHLAHQSIFEDGLFLTRGGSSGRDQANPVTHWIFDGDAVTQSFWSEFDIEPGPGQGVNYPGDRNGMVAALPVDLAPGASHTVDIAIVFARGANYLDSVTELLAASDLVQARYDDGSLFATTSGDLGLPPLAAPALVSPADGTMFTPPETVVLDWEPVADADAYRIEFSATPGFQSVRSQTAEAPPAQVDFDELPMGSFEPIYWRVTAMNAAGSGPGSEERSFTYAFEYQADVQLLSNGQQAFLEVAGPGGADPCGAAATSTFGCEEAGGNAVFGGNRGDTADANGTGQYGLFSAGGFEEALTRAAPREIEIRFTADGSIGYHQFTDSPGNEALRVPFEVWDIGLVPLGAGGVPAVNDPADDVRLVPILFSDGGDVCGFEFGEIPAGVTPQNPSGLAQTDRIYAYYPATTYADFDAVAAPLVDAASDGCYDDSGSGLIKAQIDFAERVIERITFADLTGSGSVADLEGAVVRFYTTNPQPVADEGAPTASPLALSVAPNPSRNGARVTFTLPTAGTVRVRVVDTLGRTVALLADGERRAGAHTTEVPARLAAGVYVVTVETAGERAARTLTVIR